MLTKANVRPALIALGFIYESDDLLVGTSFDHRIEVDLVADTIKYPENDGLIVNERQICSLRVNENLVVLECVYRLLQKGYHPRHIELEPRWQLGHGSSGGRADILVRNNVDDVLLLIECKTAGSEYEHAWRLTQQGKGQLFSYAHQASETEFLALYTSDFIEGAIRYENRIIAHRDNLRYLEENPKLNSFSRATTTEGRFQVWRDTYNSSYTTKGIFEVDIQPYQIGKDKYTLNDLYPISEADRRRKYNDFTTILRQHNVSGRENAFDKLVNLLLCKLVDESMNPDNLMFYWKGVAYDTEIDLLDRLQQLYQAGMAQFLGEDITYINQDDVNAALRFVRKDPDATQKAVWNLFIRQKFYTNNDFSFIDVHNEQLFYQNASILRQILEMWQDVRLTTDGASFNQFLGDMFEGFLDQGIKQSEGQFFTPIPLTRFILQALPLKGLVNASKQPPKVLDYACGAGHFLTEYSVQIAALLSNETKNAAELAHYHSNVFGIEKEYRLSKVAKVSAFMYGQPGINIVYGDALSHEHSAYQEIENETFDLIIANPPYSVKGFLETLPEDDRQRFELTSSVDPKSYDTNNSIEAFFIERAKQLLKHGGIAAIVLPSSILSNNDRPTRRARDILLEYFDILAIVELGSGAFGSTGTTTSTLYLRRKARRPDTAAHLADRVAEWFKGSKADAIKAETYDDGRVIASYALHAGFDAVSYSHFVNGDASSDLLSSEVFRGYRVLFDKDPRTRRLTNSKDFLRVGAKSQSATLQNHFVQFAQEIEREKVAAFAMARTQREPVLVVRSPFETKAMKKFLGYSWSKAKGSEGIRIVRDERGNHRTPLYDEVDRANPSKIAHYISQNFEGKLTDVPTELQEYASVHRLEDLLDFGEPKFDRAISLSPATAEDKPTSILPLMKLGDISPGLQRGASPRPIQEFITDTDEGVPWIKIGDVAPGAKEVTSTAERVTEVGAAKSRRVVPGDLIVSNSMSAGRPYLVGIEGCVHDGWLILSNILPSVSTEYLFYVLSDEFVQRQFRSRSKGPIVKNLNIERVKSVLVPIPDQETQRSIVADANLIEKKIEEAQRQLAMLNDEMIREISAVSGQGTIRLENVAKNVVDPFTPATGAPSMRFLGLDGIQSGTGRLTGLAEDEYDDATSAKRKFQTNDVLFGKLRPRLNKVFLAESFGICSTDLLVLRFDSVESAVFYAAYMRSTSFNARVLKTVTNTMPRTSWDKIKTLMVPALDSSELALWFERMHEHRRSVASIEALIDELSQERFGLVQKYI